MARKGQNRTVSLFVRVTPKELKMAHKIAGKRGKTLSEWVREKVYDASMEEAVQTGKKARR
jgi:hypothetical protein